MKKIIVLLAAAAFAFQVNAQSEKVMDKDVPAPVATSFNKSHSDIKMVEWKKMDSKYIAEYDQSGTKTYSVYDASGKLIENKIKISESDLPAPAADYIKQNYKDVMMKEYFKMTDPAGVVTYGVKAKDKKIIFDSKGNYKKTEDCKE